MDDSALPHSPAADDHGSSAGAAAAAGLTLDDLVPPFALLRREGRARVEVLRGEVRTVARLADLPTVEYEGGEQLALVPYRQLRERGDACHDDGAPLVTLVVHERSEVEVRDLPRVGMPVIRDGAFDVSDDVYARQVKAVLEDEISRGEGSNFVLRRTFVGYCDDALVTALGAFHRLLTQERGAYWTFLVHTGEQILVGATPERHVSVHGGVAVMNPISGTLRMPPAQATAEQVLGFLADPKERDELAMVVDEELKMLAEVGGHGRVTGPFLKEMRNLAHTEYYIRARTSMDVRRVLRETMFAPTATGSPIRNAFRVIKRHETGGRGYYAGVAALIGADAHGGQAMDASLLLRVAYLDPADGSVRVPVGATLVRGSDPYGEVRETHAKAAGVLRAFGVVTGGRGGLSDGRGGLSDDANTDTNTHVTVNAHAETGSVATSASASASTDASAGTRRWADDPRVLAALDARTDRLAPFWLREHAEGAFTVPQLAGRRALIVDNEDAFTSMLAVQLRALGLDVTRTPFAAVDGSAGYEQRDGLDGFDLVVVGPGPGDPRELDRRARINRVLIQRLFAREQPLLAVCLGHQFLCAALGFELARRPEPNQGTQIELDLYGSPEPVGFYNSFAALAPEAAPPGLRIATLPGSREIAALRGPRFAGVQFHAESVISVDGFGILRREISRLLTASESV